jgi:hypothetical protein
MAGFTPVGIEAMTPLGVQLRDRAMEFSYGPNRQFWPLDPPAPPPEPRIFLREPEERFRIDPPVERFHFEPPPRFEFPVVESYHYEPPEPLRLITR